ncbi:barstar family protein [Atopobium sp. oral taxon 810]|uniref:barstar family protein n=1 Tax=Atopobium sp. oral taxon 810 TaxID=712158 RepID=UPI000396C8CD|nr:barstar family protein [Atopobium sp. oral taxon 810]ERI04662.1 hypothetical protein HMPREF9069_01355 [Atopobium sp. oral taxon 810 str. F0209]
MTDIAARPHYILSAKKMSNREKALDYIYETLLLPRDGGRNLDAIADLMGELPSCVIELRHVELLDGKGPLAEWGLRLRGMLFDIAMQRDDLDLVIVR